jgi:hypothetical protein
MHWNPSARPQDNGVVERSQGTAKRWGEPQSCDSPEELHHRLQEMDVIQRQEYPSVRGRSRLEAYPELAHSGRAYTPEWEDENWSLGLVAARLAGYAVRRRMDGTGSVSLYNRNLYIGSIHKRKTVYVMFDPEVREWVFADEEGWQMSRQSATKISRENIRGLNVTHRDTVTKEQLTVKLRVGISRPNLMSGDMSSPATPLYGRRPRGTVLNKPGFPRRFAVQNPVFQHSRSPGLRPTSPRRGAVEKFGPAAPPLAAGRIGWVYDRGRLLSEGPGLPARVSTLDELLLVLRRDTPLRFDAALGFHLYGADLCLQARERGLAVVALGAPCHHNSRSTGLPEAFLSSARVFARKWAHRLPVATPCVVFDRSGQAYLLDHAPADGTPVARAVGWPLIPCKIEPRINTDEHGLESGWVSTGRPGA